MGHFAIEFLARVSHAEGLVRPDTIVLSEPGVDGGLGLVE
ncbi:hypothetical protein HY3_10520 [Hyphomonas pacifica]|uniref:Uncharacterized protein n=1 Tax=Hyphomonas pacifica TaxID=1280941 RepID=A0A062U5E3_9PROT|nr:hypothetical protein HY2_10335 [Hyphomonas pacifica]RAN34570.1 hypothetical protein HY3_10520 [Hyphomonas pacifica]RAN36323.1 hypothetical protein HY11_12210 [Hyphomonas pacifica]